MSEESWNEMTEGLKTYRNVTGKNDYILSDYEIPSTPNFPPHFHGLKLGRLLDDTRKAYRKQRLTTIQIDSLEQYQMHWDSKLYRLNFLCLPALDMYKSVFGDVRVPVKPSYVVPSQQPWPEQLWGLKLGSQVSSWRRCKDTLPLQTVASLEKRDFIWDALDYDFHTITVPALKLYGELKGNLLVPYSFCVPAKAQWPTSTHGHTLGHTVFNFRIRKGVDSEKDKVLDAMDFIWDPVRYRFETRMLPACKIYVQQKGDLNTILKSFKVPKTSSLYPVVCHGYSLGDKLHQWRLDGARPDLLDEIKALGFKPDPISFSQRDLKTLFQGLAWFQTTFGFKERVKTYKGMSTCLPDDHPKFPGLFLGQLFHRAKTWDEKIGFSNADRKKLKSFATWNSIYQSTIYPLLALYFKLHGHVDVPHALLVPSCSPWPTWSWQQKLGRNIDSIRTGSVYLSDKEKNVLESMNFKWGPKGRTPQRESKRHKAT